MRKELADGLERIAEKARAAARRPVTRADVFGDPKRAASPRRPERKRELDSWVKEGVRVDYSAVIGREPMKPEHRGLVVAEAFELGDGTEVVNLNHADGTRAVRAACMDALRPAQE